ncbi:MAG: hydantoinase/oxoprolinase family protein [Alphaproteobacteria bacterium]|nr:MAG: hydantoinase/oxoprolinase family protein [Alphaproteobacteria bacterium]
MRIGVDVGGTNTDAALMDGAKVVASVKSPTTEDIATGVIGAIRSVLKEAQQDPSVVRTVMIGTTQFTNAFVERKRLSEVAVLRLALPATQSLPPMTDWPEALVNAIGRNIFWIEGGYEFDGREIMPFNERQVLDAVRNIKKLGIRAVAVSSVFSPINPEMERRAQEIILNEIPDVKVTLASDIGRIGLVERENAAIMNSSLADLSARVVGSFREALINLGITAPFYISQNDGTLMSADYVERYPVLTFASGPTNSMRGAAYLSGLKEAIVVDIGGTTADVGVLTHGFPRESSVPVDIGGVRTNFRMPDILAVGLGGGSIVRDGEDLTVGPDSVGYRLIREGLAFGGDVMTATDIAVAAGHVQIGDVARVKRLVPDRVVDAALDIIHRTVEDAVDRMKTSVEDVPVVLVGGGSILINRDLRGASEIHVPARSAEANAIGAAIAQVGGETDRVFRYAEQGRDAALASAMREAEEKAVSAGGDPETFKVIDVEELPLSYGPGDAVRVRVKVVSDLVQ